MNYEQIVSDEPLGLCEAKPDKSTTDGMPEASQATTENMSEGGLFA